MKRITNCIIFHHSANIGRTIFLTLHHSFYFSLVNFSVCMRPHSSFLIFHNLHWPERNLSRHYCIWLNLKSTELCNEWIEIGKSPIRKFPQVMWNAHNAAVCYVCVLFMVLWLLVKNLLYIQYIDTFDLLFMNGQLSMYSWTTTKKAKKRAWKKKTKNMWVCVEAIMSKQQFSCERKKQKIIWFHIKWILPDYFTDGNFT